TSLTQYHLKTPTTLPYQKDHSSRSKHTQCSRGHQNHHHMSVLTKVRTMSLTSQLLSADSGKEEPVDMV
ncbi:MAG: hypothetical protein AAFO96_28530, partial [Bacteroidota bacterium]